MFVSPNTVVYTHTPTTEYSALLIDRLAFMFVFNL